MNHRTLSIALAAALASAGASTAFADGGKTTFTTNLTGYQETPFTLNSPGSGEFAAKISKDGKSIDYVLTYRDLPSSVLQSHIHFGRPALTGSIVLFLCTNLAPPANVPAPPACPQAPVGGATAKVTGTLTSANLISPTSTPQGLDAGSAGFAEVVAAIRNGAAYANVHTDQFKSGEIRGALGHAHDDADDDDDD
jgi:CHRD domain-containing protein